MSEQAVQPGEELTTHSVSSGAVVIRQDLTLSQMGRVFAQSGFFKDAKDPAKCVVKILAGQELGIGPIAAMRSVHVYDGQVALSAGLMTALIKRCSKYRIKVVSATASSCEIAFTELQDGEWSPCGPNVTFTVAEAQHLLKKDNWRNNQADMVYARCLSRGFRRYAADLGMGTIYVEDELDEMRSNAGPAEPEPSKVPLGDRLAQLPDSNGKKELEAPLETVVAEPEEEQEEPEEEAAEEVEQQEEPEPMEADAGPSALPEPAADAPAAEQGEPATSEPAVEPEPATQTMEAMWQQIVNDATAMQKGTLIASIRSTEVAQGWDVERANKYRMKTAGHIDLAKLTKGELARYYATLSLREEE